ncbi:hypothetical protein ACTOB_006865 [Actinoplanes oblitus]|uniref:Uncharacterized protein n=1 Tax=Actinoplanes oblitus TaxID=3040509 RepID=A0ABY8WAC9_9ACTN|nr:hypothetical protein [Actinoplanes oblitus]WIM94811.1 hypothetical protein ACTOB_006865 [Actinoplanes oblitus]
MSELGGKSLEDLCKMWNDLPISVASFADLVEKTKRDGPRSDAAYAMKAVAEEIAELNEVATVIADRLLAGEEQHSDCHLSG